MSLGVVILCGGESRRMGRPKAWLPFGAEWLLQRVVRLVTGVAQDVAVVAAPGQVLPPLPASVIVARDPVRGRGPLQGLAAGLAALPEHVELAYATATDVPFLDPEWIKLLLRVIGNHDLAMPYCQGFHHPLAALYRRSRALPAIAELLRADRLRPVFLMEALSTRVVTEPELREIDPGLGTLRNLNTPEDYRAALGEAGVASEEEPRGMEARAAPRIRVELFGVARSRAGAAEIMVQGAELGEALADLGTVCPALEGPVIVAGRLRPSFAVNLNGDRFVTDPDTRLHDGDSLIMLDLDAGG
jgi:molybdopterin-guanine dinucleotide biosynthesis protein A